MPTAARCIKIRPVATEALWRRVALGAAVVVLAGVASAGAGGGRDASACVPLPADPAYDAGVLQALAQREDAWGNALLASPGGPTYDGVHGLLHPLMMVGKPAGLKPRRLTDSGIYYLPFGRPRGWGGAGVVQLHVADGSQVVSRRVDGSKLTVFVGTRGKERYGSCPSRLETPRLAQGYLPILETAYADADGVRYRQESFAARIPQTRALVSFIRLTVDPSGTRAGAARIRFTPSVRLHRVRHQLRHGRRARLLFGKNLRFDGDSLVTTVRRPRQIYLAWLDRASRTRPVQVNKVTYAHARASVEDYWAKRLETGAELVVPEQRVYDAERNLLIQNLLLSWRYSLGNAYAHFSWELLDVGEVMGAYGYPGIERAILDRALRAPTLFPNRSAGERMVGSADYLRRFGDTNFVERVTPRFRRDVQSFGRQLDASAATGLLRRERYGADISGPIYGLHAQVLALQGLRATADLWARTGRPLLAAQATGAADRLEAGLRSAVAASEVQLPDGSLFVPIELMDGLERPYDALTATKRGAYWNLVMPYVLASGFIRPGSAEATGVLRYLLKHGSRFLGLVRFSPHTGVINPGYERPGSDDVYGTNVARFLADNDQPDQLRAQPLRQARRGDDGEHVRLRRGLDDRAVLRPVLPLDAPAAEQREQRLLPRDAAADARPRDQWRERPAAGARARLRDAARLARGGQADRGAAPADELRAALVHARRRCHLGAGEHRPAERLQRPAAAPAATAGRPAARRGDRQRQADYALRRPGDDRPLRGDRARRRRRTPAALAEAPELAGQAEPVQERLVLLERVRPPVWSEPVAPPRIGELARSPRR